MIWLTIGDYVSIHPDLKGDNLISFVEPRVSGYTVGLQADGVQTDEKGNFSLLYKSGASSENLKINDLNAGTPALEMRYINLWNKEVVIPTLICSCEIDLVLGILPADNAFTSAFFLA
jgi:hypothetical protein